jgi:DNA-binding transcriptional ArsR family regulator
MAAEGRRDVFQAIADPNRRQMIDLIAKEPMTLNAIAEQFDISRPAVSQHIKILEECGLVTVEKKGRERYCTIQPQNLVPAYLWLDQFSQQWKNRISNFENYVKQLKAKTT